jgi:hypothetical protein
MPDLHLDAARGQLAHRAPKIYADLRYAVKRARSWFAESQKAATLASIVPGMMPGRNLELKAEFAEGNAVSRRLNRIANFLPTRTTYLEIGVDRGITFGAVDLPFKWGVDPSARFNTRLLPQGCRFTPSTSDEFFASLDPRFRFDLIYIDGLHQWQQTYRDLLNCISHSHLHTVIVMDDVVPVDEFSSWPDMQEALEARYATGNMSSAWQGDVYKVMFAIRDYHPEIEYRVITEGNPQAVIWSRVGWHKSGQADRASDDSYLDLDYSSVFSNGQVPSWFTCVTEDEALEEVSRAFRG